MRLEITLPAAVGADLNMKAASPDSLADSLLPLASICPQLHSLNIMGQVGPDFLPHFGYCCPKIEIFEATLTGIPVSSLKQLPNILPQLTSLVSLHRPHTSSCVMQGAKQQANQKARLQAEKQAEEALCLTMKVCPAITSLDTGTFSITSDIWVAMPRELQHLSCTLPRYIHWDDRRWGMHDNLRTLRVRHWESHKVENLPVRILVVLLTAAPRLEVLHFPECAEVSAVCCLGDARDLDVLQQRMNAGLQITGSHISWPVSWPSVEGSFGPGKIGVEFDITHSLSRGVTSDSEEDEEESQERQENKQMSWSAFMTSMSRPLSSFSQLHLKDLDDVIYFADMHVDLSQLPRVFPNLRMLRLNTLVIKEGDVHSLIGCELLQRVWFQRVEGFDDAGLQELCAGCKELGFAFMQACRDVELAGKKKKISCRILQGIETFVFHGDGFDDLDS